MFVHYLISRFLSLHFTQNKLGTLRHYLTLVNSGETGGKSRETYKVKPLPQQHASWTQPKTKITCFPFNFLMIGPLQVWEFQTYPFSERFMTLKFHSRKTPGWNFPFLGINKSSGKNTGESLGICGRCWPPGTLRFTGAWANQVWSIEELKGADQVWDSSGWKNVLNFKLASWW